MSPMKHHAWACRLGLLAVLAGGALVAMAFFSRGFNGQFLLVQWAGLLSDAGLYRPLAHFILWALALAFLGFCFAAVMVAFCRYVPASCPQCGGAAYWQSEDTVAYVCRGCGHRHDTGIGWGEK
jgi:hypothetical protein